MRYPRFCSRHSALARLLMLAAVGCWLLPCVRLEAQLSEAGSYLIDPPANGQGGDQMGTILARGDFNSDGFDDLAMGQPLDTIANLGLVRIVFGGTEGLEGAPFLTLRRADALPGSICQIPGGQEVFGGALAVGDFDADGFDDLAIGADGKDVEGIFTLGAVSVFFGRADSTFEAGPCFVYGRDGLPGDAMDETRFGSSLATGDFDSDGRADLAIGAVGATVDGQAKAGSVTVISGSLNGPLDPNTATLWHQNVEGIPGTAESFDFFGFSLATGDLVQGLDVACDLVIGAPGDDLDGQGSDRGSVQVLFGCGDNGLGVENTVRWRSLDFPNGGAQDGERMGTSVAVGNFDCASADDLAIGVPERLGGGGLGSVFMVYGNQQDLSSVILTTFDAFDLGGPFPSANRLGTSMVASRLDGPCEDLVVSAPGSAVEPEAGTLFVLEGRFAIGITPGFGSSHSWSDPSSAVRLGLAMAVGRFTGTTPSLAAGVPRRNPPGGDPQDGGVWVLPSAQLFADGFESGNLQAWALTVGAAPSLEDVSVPIR